MVLTTGCSQGLHGMIRLIARTGDVVACEAPAYYSTLEIMGDLGVKVLPIPVTDSDGIDFELTQTLFHRFKPKLFVLCSTLSNPSGATFAYAIGVTPSGSGEEGELYVINTSPE
jgi:DNA-binding transcriptional MocR family regulator